MGWTKKCAVVTGGGYGVGRAVALMLAEDGWSIVIVERDPTRAQSAARQITEGGGRALPVVGDVTDAATFARAVEAGRTLDPIHGLVTCAAMRHVGAITSMTEAQWKETLDVVLNGVFLACKAVIPEMIAAGGGSIVNVSSPDSFARRNMVAYSSAKAAVSALSQCLALDHMEQGIRVNTVLPVFTRSGLNEHYDEARVQRAAATLVARRPAMPEETAQIIRFLMSDTAETMTGGLFGQTPANR